MALKSGKKGLLAPFFMDLNYHLSCCSLIADFAIAAYPAFVATSAEQAGYDG